MLAIIQMMLLCEHAWKYSYQCIKTMLLLGQLNTGRGHRGGGGRRRGSREHGGRRCAGSRTGSGRRRRGRGHAGMGHAGTRQSESASESEETSVVRWKKIKPATDKSPASLSFTSGTGVQVSPCKPYPSDVFFDTALMELLVTETNTLVHRRVIIICNK